MPSTDLKREMPAFLTHIFSRHPLRAPLKRRYFCQITFRDSGEKAVFERLALLLTRWKVHGKVMWQNVAPISDKTAKYYGLDA